MTARKKVVFLALDEVLELHAEQLDRHEAREASVISRCWSPRSRCLGRPSTASSCTGTCPRWRRPTSSTSFGIIPSSTGTRELGSRPIAFLGLNGSWLEADPDELAGCVLEVARGAMPKSELAEYIRRHVVPFETET